VKKRVATVNKKISATKILKQGILFSLALLFVFALPVSADNRPGASNGYTISDDATPDEIIDDETDEYPSDAYPYDENDPQDDDDEVIENPVLWQDSMIADRTPSRLVGNLQLRGVFPDIQPEFGSAYADLNADISDAAGALIDTALRLRARTITFTYEVISTQNVVSVIMYASVAAITTREIVTTINFHPETGARLSVACVMGADFPALAEAILTDWARQYPERHYSAITAPISAFYITDELLVLLFDEFQVSTEAGSLTYVHFTLENIVRIPGIGPGRYRINRDLYNFKHIPIDYVMHYLGYRVEVIPVQGPPKIRIWSDGDAPILMTELQVGVNRFSWYRSNPRTLELPPIAYTHRPGFLVPITFFDQIMPRITYRVDGGGYIHFLAYVGR